MRTITLFIFRLLLQRILQGGGREYYCVESHEENKGVFFFFSFLFFFLVIIRFGSALASVKWAQLPNSCVSTFLCRERAHSNKRSARDVAGALICVKVIAVRRSKLGGD